MNILINQLIFRRESLREQNHIISFITLISYHYIKISIFLEGPYEKEFVILIRLGFDLDCSEVFVDNAMIIEDDGINMAPGTESKPLPEKRIGHMAMEVEGENTFPN